MSLRKQKQHKGLGFSSLILPKIATGITSACFVFFFFSLFFDGSCNPTQKQFTNSM